VIQAQTSVYFAGDTALFPGMADLGQAYDLDLALLPVWGFGPFLRGDHMTPHDAAQALEMLCPRVAVPIHWGTLRPLGPGWNQLSFLNDPPYTFAGYAARLAPETCVRVLEPGQSMTWETRPHQSWLSLCESVQVGEFY
jgi:L-ascorbate metabolism protein UlaG (beta-lactamase superfamily)